MCKKALAILTVTILAILSISVEVFSQESVSSVKLQEDYKTFSAYNLGMGGLLYSNIYDPYAFLSNPSIVGLQDFNNTFIILGIQGLLPIQGTRNFYPFFDYSKFDDTKYLSSFSSQKSMYGLSSPLQFVFLNKIFSGAIFINSYSFEMEYAGDGSPPAMNKFKIKKDIMIALNVAYPFVIHLSDDVDDDLIIDIGLKFQYLQRDLFTCELDSASVLGLKEFDGSELGNKTFRKITNGYFKFNLIGFDSGLTIKYKMMIFSVVFNNISFIPRENKIGSVFKGKRYDANNDEIDMPEDIYMIPSSLNFSVAVLLDSFIDEQKILTDFYIGVDVTGIIKKSFELSDIKIGMHGTLYNRFDLMLGTDFTSITFGSSVKIWFFDFGVSYVLNFDRYLYKDDDGFKKPVETDYFSFSLMFIF